MGNLSQEQLRNIIINLNKNQNVTDTNDIIPQQTDPYGSFMKRRGDINQKKWGYAILMSLFATFIFSSIFLTFLDDICIKKDVNILDMNGNPKIVVIIILFGLVLSLNRICIELIDK